jgi:hypothetical protein
MSVSDNLDYKCPQCELSFKTEKRLNINIGKAHKKEELPTPEKERGASAQEDLALTLSPPKECREELEDALEEVIKEPNIFQLSPKCDTKTCIKSVQGIEEMVRALAQQMFLLFK